MNLIPSTTELSPAPAPKGAASKGAASCPGLHQVAKIFKDWDTTTPGTLSYVWPISIPCLLPFHCTPLTWAQPFLPHNPHQEEGESDTPSSLFQEPHFLTSHTKSLSSPAVSATLPDSLAGYFRPRTWLFRHHLASTEQRTTVLLYLSAVLLLMQPSTRSALTTALPRLYWLLSRGSFADSLCAPASLHTAQMGSEGRTMLSHTHSSSHSSHQRHAGQRSQALHWKQAWTIDNGGKTERWMVWICG